MAYRLTDTNKWHDAWFSSLKPIEKLLFNYLCDNCNNAGFIEIVTKDWAVNIGCSVSMIEGALKGLSRGLIYSKSSDCIYIRRFLKHQKDIPLMPEKNPKHIGIINIFKNYAHKFDIDITNLESFILGTIQGLDRDYNNSNSNSSIFNNNLELKKEEDINKVTSNTWKTNFEVYKKEVSDAYKALVINQGYIKERETFHPGLDIQKTLEKTFKDYWSTERAWKDRKRKKSLENDWKRTFNNALTMKCNQVWKEREYSSKAF